MESKLRITLPDGRTFEMPDVHENRDLYERMNRNAKSDRDHVKIETITASPHFEDKPVETPAQPRIFVPKKIGSDFLTNFVFLFQNRKRIVSWEQPR